MAFHNDFRPKRLSEVVGQESVTKTLKNAALSGRLSEYQALLFTGTRGAGKTTTARILAHMVNCKNLVNGEPCMVCDACKVVSQSLDCGGDVTELDAASKNSIKDIDLILESTQYHPHSPITKKVYILDEAHQLSGAAKDRLLKTLEEPPSHVLFILATTEDHKIPATIGSRCIKFKFKPATPKEIAGYLKTVLDAYGGEYEEPALEKVGTLAQGSYRDALGIVEKLIDTSECVSAASIEEALCLPDRSFVVTVAKAIVAGDMATCIQITSNVINQGRDVRLFLREVNEILVKRAALMAEQNQTKSPEGLTIPDFIRVTTFIHTQAGLYPSELSGMLPGLILAGAAAQVQDLMKAA